SQGISVASPRSLGTSLGRDEELRSPRLASARSRGDTQDSEPECEISLIWALHSCCSAAPLSRILSASLSRAGRSGRARESRSSRACEPGSLCNAEEVAMDHMPFDATRDAGRRTRFWSFASAALAGALACVPSLSDAHITQLQVVRLESPTFGG